MIQARGTYERDLDASEAVFIALRRIAPGEEKTLREIQRVMYLLRHVHPGLSALQVGDLIEHQLRNFGGFLPGLELVRSSSTNQISGVRHAG